MPLINVRKATNTQVDYLVAKCEGTPITLSPLWRYPGTPRQEVAGWQVWQDPPERDEFGAVAFCPSTDWSQGGPILTRERISRVIDHSGLWVAYWTDGYVEGDEGKLCMQCDSSELVAGLRCYVALKMGEEVEVPEELLL